MSWLGSLAGVYDSLVEVGKINPGKVKGLMPPVIIEQNAHLEILIDEDSQFIKGEIVEKKQGSTFVPVTERSAGRTNVSPHPIFDRIMYLAGDLENYSDEEFREKYYLPYITQLKTLHEKQPNNEFLRIVYEYLVEETLATDLINHGIFSLNDEGQLDLTEKISGELPHRVFVRIAVEIDGDTHKLWEDFNFINNYSEFYINQLTDNDKALCYITGREIYPARLHGKNIRRQGDSAKLISSNDGVNYTYRGRFFAPNQVVQIGYELSEKAHSALRWLIRRQAFRTPKLEYTVLAYSQDVQVLQPFQDSVDSAENLRALTRQTIEPGEHEIDLGINEAEQLKNAITGYQHHLNPDDKIYVLALDNAVPGRLAIQYYREFQATDYFDNILYYHDTMSWRHMKVYSKEERAKTGKTSYIYIGAPHPRDIVNCTFGVERQNFMDVGSDKYYGQQLQRLLPCILERARIPQDFVKGAFENAVTPLGKSYYNWQRCLSVACSLARKYYIERKQVEYTMALDRSITDRSYLYGRLLAVAEKVEGDAIRKQSSGDSGNRVTNARRYMNMLSKRPYSTWLTIEKKLQPYLNRLNPGERTYYQIQFQNIMSLFDFDDYKDNRALEGTFVLGFHCQMQDFYTKKSDENSSAEVETEADAE